MKIIRAYKTEIDPTNCQRTVFVQWCGASRFAYNWALDDRIAHYDNGEKSNLYEQKRRFNALKKTEYPWLGGLPCTITENAFANLDVAYRNFFRRVKQGKEKAGFPRFKSKKKGLGTATVRGCLHIKNGRVKLKHQKPAPGVDLLSD